MPRLWVVLKGGIGNGEMRNEEIKKWFLMDFQQTESLERSKIKALHPNQTLGTPKLGTPKAN